MKTIKPQKLGLLHRTLENGDDTYFVVTLLVLFRLSPSPILLPEVSLWKLVAEELGGAIDVGMPKQRGEILVTGKAYAPGHTPRPACAARVAIGSIDKTLYVVGDRFWRSGVASDPVPFVEMPIRYENAFGGDGYARNPVGKGVARVLSSQGPIHPLPNVEDPRCLIKAPGETPPPACFGPYELTWPQRFSKAGTYDAAWLKERFPDFAVDMDWTIFNAAPDDQQIAGYFQGDEAFRVENMHADKPVLEGKLPAVATRAFINQKTDTGEVLREMVTRLDTVHLFPHVERGILIYRGMVKIAEDDAADVRQLLIACEALGAPKSVEHYRAVLAQRLDHEKGAVYALRDDDLMPPADPAAEAVPDEMKRLEQQLRGEGFAQKHGRRRREIEHAKAVERIKAQGLEPAAMGFPEALPPDEPIPTLDELPAFMDRMKETAAKHEVDTKAAAAKVVTENRQAMAAVGLDADAILRSAEGEGAGGPPKFSAKEEIERLEATVQMCRNGGLPIPELEAMVADPELRARLARMEQQLEENYRKLAHHFPAAARLDGEASARLRNEIVRARVAGESFAGRDLTGADLSHLDLHGADFHGAFLETANLSGSDLSGCDFSEAVLARADLSKAKLEGAKLRGANLGGARLHEADARGGVDLEGAILAKADLSGAYLTEARMAGADVSEAVFSDTELGDVKAPNALFYKVDLSHVAAGLADLTKAVFLEAKLEGADFSSATLTGATFLGCHGDKVVFRGAEMKNLRVVRDSSFEGADFRGAFLEEANLRGTRLTGSDFSETELRGADLSECDLRDATFRDANARGAQFVKADLMGAVMTGVDLMFGSVQKAKIAGVDLQRSSLFGVDFAKARGDGATNVQGANLKRIRVVRVKNDGS